MIARARQGRPVGGPRARSRIRRPRCRRDAAGHPVTEQQPLIKSQSHGNRPSSSSPPASAPRVAATCCMTEESRRFSFVFSHVRRSDVALAVVAVLGVVAGLILTIASKFGASGPVLLAVGVVAAVAVAVRGLWEVVAPLSARQSQQGDWLAAISRVPIAPITEIDPFGIGVFRSELAAREAPNPDMPPYVPRRIVDDALRRALTEPYLERTRRLVVVRGDPKSGKSRTMWEAVRVLPGRRLLALVPPLASGDATEPGYEPLGTLLRLERPVSRSNGRDLVIWVDDAQLHLQRGLTRDNLRRLVGRYPNAIVVMTIHSNDLAAIKDFDPLLHALLREPFEELILKPVLSPSELADAEVKYPGLADNRRSCPAARALCGRGPAEGPLPGSLG